MWKIRFLWAAILPLSFVITLVAVSSADDDPPSVSSSESISEGKPERKSAPRPEPDVAPRSTSQVVKPSSAVLRQPQPGEVAQWLEDLQSVRFQDREDASENLALSGRYAVGPLLEVILQSDGIEVGRRAINLLREIAKSSDPDDFQPAIDALVKAQKMAVNSVIPRRAAEALAYLTEFRMQQAWQITLGLGGRVPRSIITGVPGFRIPARPYTELEIGEDWQGGAQGLSQLKWLTRVQKLVLVGSKVNGEWLPYVAEMSNLRKLVLTNPSPISAEEWQHLDALANLRELRIEGCSIDDAGLAHVGTLTELESLAIEGKGITDAGLGHVLYLKRLRAFSVKHSNTTDMGLGALAKLQSLESLTIEGSLARGSSLSKLATLPFLNYLTIAGSQVTDDWLVHVARMSKLHVLQIKSASITDEGLAPLKQLRELWRLDLFYSPISDHGLEVLLGAPLVAERQPGKPSPQPGGPNQPGGGQQPRNPNQPQPTGYFRVRQHVRLYGTKASRVGADQFRAALARLNPPDQPKVDYGTGGFLGVACIPSVSPCTIDHVEPGSAAAKAGLKPKDVIVKYNGQSVDEFQSLRLLIGKNPVGDRVRIEILREKKTIQFELVLGGWK